MCKIALRSWACDKLKLNSVILIVRVLLGVLSLFLRLILVFSCYIDVCLGGSLRIELRAKTQFIGCLSTIIVFMLVPLSTTTNPVPSSAGFPDRLGSGDASSRSARFPVTQGLGSEHGDAAYIIRRVKVYYRDEQMEELRPTTPFRRPPRVSGKRATEQVEGLPLER